ncbi:MAG TPA: glycosyltransferase family 9 protein [Stellaceae bacterium]|nr:glycosyltransferase family 9 protein [Stellaceae bacterium]
MILAAAKALKARFNCPLFLGVMPAYRELAKACRHVDDAFSDWESLKSASAPYPPEAVLGVDVSYYRFSVAPRHQVDAYLAFFNVEAPPHLKDIELRSDPRAEARAEEAIAAWPPLPAGKARILVHPGSGDANRTWPQARWEELASRLILAGHQVVVIGSRTTRNDRGVHELAVAGLITIVDRLEPLATVALMRRAHLLVCTDGGPVQLAGATEIGIVGIYSVVAGANRLPFRHGKLGWGARAVSPECAAHPCIHQLSDAAIKERIDRAIHGELASPFGEWCARPDRYHCMTHEITVSMVLDACQHMAAERQTRIN